jgi:hypothetical protein
MSTVISNACLTLRRPEGPSRRVLAQEGCIFPQATKADQIALQLRLPRDEVRTIKIAAAQRDQTLSDSRLHAFMHK